MVKFASHQTHAPAPLVRQHYHATQVCPKLFSFNSRSKSTGTMWILFCPESCGLCSTADITDSQTIYSLTFGAGTDQYSAATPGSFGFTTTYIQQNTGPLSKNSFTLVNAIPADYPQWDAGPLDHTVEGGGDGSNGYMMLVAASGTADEVFRIQVDSLVVGSRYEFSAYVANVIKGGNNLIKPNLRFEVRTASAEHTLLANVTSGDIDEYDTLTWNQYTHKKIRAMINLYRVHKNATYEIPFFSVHQYVINLYVYP